MFRYFPLFAVLFFLSGCSLWGGLGGSDSTYEVQRSSGEIPLSTTPSTVQLDPPAKGEEIAIIKTEKGDIFLRLFPDDAPKAVENFKTHARNGYFNGLTFHRVVTGFIIQGGDPKGDGTGGESIWGGPFADELTPKRKNLRGALSMANSGPNTNGSQFFINEVNNLQLDGYEKNKLKNCGEPVKKETGEEIGKVSCHTVFGQVFKGFEVIDSIAATPVDPKGKPETPVTMTIEIVPYGG